MTTEPADTARELDVRQQPTPARHPQIVAAFDGLAVGESLVLVNDHEPRHLREEFDRDLTGSFEWQMLQADPGACRVRITRTASTPLPRVLLDTTEVAAGLGEPDTAGALWRLDPSTRGLDANLIALPGGDSIQEHVGADLDVLLHVVAGSGVVSTEAGDVPVTVGAVVYLPRRARRAVHAGPEGLRYLSVHTRKETIPLTPTVRPAGPLA